jgi:hypothetical protein
MKSIQEFCATHKACQDGREWALTNCKSMLEVWEKAKPEWLLWIATRKKVLTDQELRLFAVFCARQVQHLMPDWWSINAINVAEKFANGQATTEQLAAASSKAADVSRAAAKAAAVLARVEPTATAEAASEAAFVAWAVSWVEAKEAALVASWDAARATAWNTSQNICRSETWAAAKTVHADWLRKNTNPNFGNFGD